MGTLTQPCEPACSVPGPYEPRQDRKSTRLNSSHQITSYAVFCLKNKSDDLSVCLAFRRAYSLPADTSAPKGTDHSRVLALGDRQKPQHIPKSEELCARTRKTPRS